MPHPIAGPCRPQRNASGAGGLRVRCSGRRKRRRTPLDSRLRGSDGKFAGVWRVRGSVTRTRRTPLDSRLRGNDGRGRSGNRRADYHFRCCGNDVGGLRAYAVRTIIPAVAGMTLGAFGHTPCGLSSRRCGNDAIDMDVAVASAVIPAQAGIQRCSRSTRMAAPDAPCAGVDAVIPAGPVPAKVGSGNPSTFGPILVASSFTDRGWPPPSLALAGAARYRSRPRIVSGRPNR